MCRSVIGTQNGLDRCYAMNLLMLPGRTVFIADTYVNYDPTAEQLADMTLLAAEEIRNFGMQPKVALLVALDISVLKTRQPRSRCAMCWQS
jgi:malate dehydrogenase (oxaloacetate-decarboxylating)(NADP+)